MIPTRRSFLAALAGAFALDPERALWERALWVRGAKLISIPRVREPRIDVIATRFYEPTRSEVYTRFDAVREDVICGVHYRHWQAIPGSLAAQAPSIVLGPHLLLCGAEEIRSEEVRSAIAKDLKVAPAHIRVLPLEIWTGPREEFVRGDFLPSASRRARFGA